MAREGRFVYYLITKPKYNDKPTYDSLTASLQAMRSHMEAFKVTSVSMPEIGCGLDGLQWNRVFDILVAVFTGSGMTINVCHFQPARQMRSRDAVYA